MGAAAVDAAGKRSRSSASTGTQLPINHSDERKKAPPPPKNYPPCKWSSSMDTSEKRPDLAMGRRPIAISEEIALAFIEEVRLLF